ncbi:hypothetical protein CEQ90_14475 [Lewinellaceae bacterium SD302]|nr:hypothetical protein CEQ90_14475 [Lewinellaceae bacterium SD302]
MAHFKTLVFVTLLFALFEACSPPPKKTPDAPVGSRQVIAPDRIYFKNIRASRYSSTDDHVEHRTAYVHKKAQGAPVGWKLRLVDDWLNDLSWLELAESEEAIFYRIGVEKEEMLLFESGQVGDLATVKVFADRLAASYEICRRNVSATVSDCLPAESPYRLALRETIADYLRLTNGD